MVATNEGFTVTHIAKLIGVLHQSADYQTIILTAIK